MTSTKLVAGLPRRIAIAGPTGSGKSSLGRRLQSRTGIEYKELDQLYYGPNWTRRAGFTEEVSALAREGEWITDWSYDETFERLAREAELIIWLDYPTSVVLRSVVLRNLLRRLHKEELWAAGNTEGPLVSALWNPQHAVRYTFRSKRSIAQSLKKLMRDRTTPAIQRFRSPLELNRWLKDVVVAQADHD